MADARIHHKTTCGQVPVAPGQDHTHQNRFQKLEADLTRLSQLTEQALYPKDGLPLDIIRHLNGINSHLEALQGLVANPADDSDEVLIAMAEMALMPEEVPHV